ncbi:hypothetical protein [Endozoicomonas sp. SESOKO3]|uniref:hypothetical protein n=1 Tax=Endozoicomonas sp. SESOKO3 TaxID=2828744 RepID=UPI0021483288|nr:hypothetical protein [Endozoicomonas sp. SESOKO3]
MDISSTSNPGANALNESFWLVGVTDSEESDAPTTGTFHSRKTSKEPLGLQNLKIRGFSQREISAAEKTLKDRNISPTYEAISNFLGEGWRSNRFPLFHQLSEVIEQTPGVQGKARLAQTLIEFVGSLKDDAVRELDQHYASLWPDRQEIATIVDRWPPELKEQAQYIKRNWPELVVKGDMKFNFGSTTKVCSSHYRGYRKAPSELGYLAFFRLIKDIWFDALKTDNACTMNRVCHLLISFTKEISGNTILYEGASRKEQFENVIQRELKKGISSTYDIGAFAFLLVANPALWSDHKHETFQLMTSRAFNSKADELAHLYSHWQEPAKQDQVCKTVEAEVIPEIAITLHYLGSIYNYLMSYRSQVTWRNKTLNEELASGDYFDSTTNQLVHPIQVAEWKTLPPLTEVKEILSQFYNNPSHQKLFLGTEEFKAFQQEQRRLKARQRFAEAIQTTTNQIKKERADLIKKQFKEQGFTARKDDQGNISYGEAYYQARKQYMSHLKEQKLAVEQHIGVPIPFKVTALQLNQTLEAFDELPTAEQRYWKMSRAYAESTAIPELLADLSLTQDWEDTESSGMLAHEHEKLKEKQSKFITCRCSECTVCEATRYLCECPDGLNQRIARRENKQKDYILKKRIIKSVEAYYAENFCKEGTPVLAEDNQTAIPAVQTQNPKKRKRENFLVDRDISPLSRPAKMPRFEHTLTDGSLCEKKHHSESLIDRHKRDFITKVIHKKVYSPEKFHRRHQRSAEPAGQRKYNKVLRQLYKSYADNPSSRISITEILDCFDKNPKQAIAAVNDLKEKPQEIRSLFKPGTLELAIPKSLKAIPCQVIYHNIESFNNHLHDLAAGKDNNFIPLDKRKVKGLYLHKTFCLACRTNFGQKRELQAHLKETHQATMENTFERIRAGRLEPTNDAAIAPPESPIENREPQTIEQMPFDQRLQAIPALFEHESV